MAARSNTSVFTMVFMAIVITLALTFLVTTIVFASRATAAQDLADTATEQRDAVLRGASDEEQSFARTLAQDQNVQGELAGALSAYRALASYAGGRSSDVPSDVRRRSFERVQEAAEELLANAAWAQDQENAPLARELRDIAGANPDDPPQLNRVVETMVLALGRSIQDRTRLEAEYSTTLANAEQAIRQVDSIRSELDSFRQQQLSRVDAYGADVEDYGDDIAEAQQRFQREASRIRDEFEGIVSEKDRRISELIDEVTTLQDIVDGLDRNRVLISPRGEALLTDGTVVGVDPTGDEVFLSLGRDDKLPLGITFTVYDRDASVRPNEITGELPEGKAVVEVVRIDNDTAVARVLRRSRGNRIAEGDKLVNAVYDPNKTYRFIVFGNFDMNGDFVATPGERRDVQALIREWGGVVDDELTGNTDFVVLGERPVLPPEPNFDDPPAVLQRFAEARQAQLRYDELFDRASSTRIPVLNQNRLFTLTGLGARR
jgi:hypothetical protein